MLNRLIAAALVAGAAASLGACGKKADQNVPSAEENAQLENAADMLDTSPDSLVAGDNTALGNGEDDDEDAGNGA